MSYGGPVRYGGPVDGGGAFGLVGAVSGEGENKRVFIKVGSTRVLYCLSDAS